MLNEQLQSKEVELLQLRTEVETQQGMPLICYKYYNGISIIFHLCVISIISFLYLYAKALTYFIILRLY